MIIFHNTTIDPILFTNTLGKFLCTYKEYKFIDGNLTGSVLIQNGCVAIDEIIVFDGVNCKLKDGLKLDTVLIKSLEKKYTVFDILALYCDRDLYNDMFKMIYGVSDIDIMDEDPYSKRRQLQFNSKPFQNIQH